MLSDALGAIGFSWAACPAMTELEIHMLQWFGEMIGLPVAFLPFAENGTGGGVIQVIIFNCDILTKYEWVTILKHGMLLIILIKNSYLPIFKRIRV